MTDQQFGDRLRSLRNGSLTTTESLKVRNSTFVLYAVCPFESLDIEDVLWALEAAAADPTAGHLQLYFLRTTADDIRKPGEEFVAHLAKYGFTNPGWNAIATSRQFGWLRIKLFSQEDLIQLRGLDSAELHITSGNPTRTLIVQ